MNLKIFADGANVEDIVNAYHAGTVSGFTTNPTLMRQAGIADYTTFAAEVLRQVKDKPISFEVFADDLPGMAQQAARIASWGDNVYVKIPVTNTRGVSTAPLIRELAAGGVKLNITAILTIAQVETVVAALDPATPAVVSVFAGRIADTGRDPVPLMREALLRCGARPLAELLWASPREVLNIYQAEAIGCHIVTVTADLLKKLSLKGKDLAEYSLETVAMFHRDAAAAGYAI